MHTLEQLSSGAVAGTRRLNLSCGLTELQQEVFQLSDTLEVLNLSCNRLRNLPHQLPRLHKLKVLFASDDDFTLLPEVLGSCAGSQTPRSPCSTRWSRDEPGRSDCAAAAPGQQAQHRHPHRCGGDNASLMKLAV